MASYAASLTTNTKTPAPLFNERSGGLHPCRYPVKVDKYQLRTAARVLIIVPGAVTIYALALHWVFVDLIQPTFAYSGYRYEPSSEIVVAATLVTAIAVALFLPRRIRRPSAIILWILYVVTVAPTILMSSYIGILTPGHAVVTSAGIGGAFAAVCLGVRRKRATRPLFNRLSLTSFWLVVGAFTLFVYVYLAATAGLSLRFIAILDVYDVREDYSETLGGAALLGYLVSTQANVINPLIFARGIYSRKAFPIAVAILGQLVLYSGTGFKTIVFSIPSLLLVAWLFRANLRPRGVLFLGGAAGVILVAATLDELTNGIIWSSLFARRFLITPAMLSAYYVDFYGTNGHEYLSHSILAPFIDPTHPYGPARMIGLYIRGEVGMAANANLFADGFAQFGWFGVAGIALLLIIYLRVLDRAAYGLPTAVAAIVVVMPSIALSNTSMLTSMFSHGLFAVLVVLAIAPRDGWGPIKTKPPVVRRQKEVVKR